MIIDWFTVSAQALNFAVLVWLMKRYLYRPILDAIDERERRIAATLADAEAKKAEAQREREAFRHESDEFEQQRATLLSQAQHDAEAERRRLLDAARREADELSARRRDALQADALRLNDTLVRRTQQEVLAIARQTLADLATADLDERIAEVFACRLRALDGEAKASLAQALAAGTGPALVRSAFDLPAGSRAAIQSAVNEAFAGQIALRFETAPDLIGGMELSAHGRKLAWSMADHLASLQQGVDELTRRPPVAPPAKA